MTRHADTDLVRPLATGLYAQAQVHVRAVLLGQPAGAPPHLAAFIAAERTERHSTLQMGMARTIRP